MFRRGGYPVRIGNDEVTPTGPAPVPVPGIEALQTTLGQFIGTMTKVVARLAHPGTGQPGLNPSGVPEDIEGIKCCLVQDKLTETVRLKMV